jgi:hypothetical protein
MNKLFLSEVIFPIKTNNLAGRVFPRFKVIGIVFVQVAEINFVGTEKKCRDQKLRSIQLERNLTSQRRKEIAYMRYIVVRCNRVRAACVGMKGMLCMV